jgi:hypothetical protein
MDEVAREYLRIGLALGELEEGIVDSYFGPPEIRDEVRANPATAQQLIERAATLRARVPNEIDDAQRARYLDRQLVAIETLARQISGEEIPYLELVRLCFDAEATATPDAEYAAARSALEDLLPGDGDLRDRLKQRDDELTIPADRLLSVVHWVVGELRSSAATTFEATAVVLGEDPNVTLVTDQPWSAYNWYRGDLRSDIEINTDQPTRATGLVPLLAHEAFPGHHVEHVSKEQRLVRDQGRLESSVQLINTPEAFISEGLAEVGVRFVAAPERWQELLIGICEQAGIEMSADRAQREWHIYETLHRLRGSGGDTALKLHVEGQSREDVIAFLEHSALRTREQAEKSLEFVLHPLWRAYVFCYAGGERLLGTWVESAPDHTSRRDRFARLLTEQLTPSGIRLEMAQTL